MLLAPALAGAWSWRRSRSSPSAGAAPARTAAGSSPTRPATRCSRCGGSDGSRRAASRSPSRSSSRSASRSSRSTRRPAARATSRTRSAAACRRPRPSLARVLQRRDTRRRRLHHVRLSEWRCSLLVALVRAAPAAGRCDARRDRRLVRRERHAAGRCALGRARRDLAPRVRAIARAITRAADAPSPSSRRAGASCSPVAAAARSAPRRPETVVGTVAAGAVGIRRRQGGCTTSNGCGSCHTFKPAGIARARSAPTSTTSRPTPRRRTRARSRRTRRRRSRTRARTSSRVSRRASCRSSRHADDSQVNDLVAFLTQKSLKLPADFPADVDRDRVRPRPHADRRGLRPAAAHARRARCGARRRAACGRRHGTHVPGRAPLPHRARAGRLLPGRRRRRSRDRRVPPPRADPARARARGDRGDPGRRLRAQLLRRRRAVRRARDARGGGVRELPAHRAPRRRAAARVARAAADEARRRRRPRAARRARRDLRARFDGRLFIAKSLPFFLEFAHPDVSKGSGLSSSPTASASRRERTIAFGDGENDLELIDWAGYAVAVENAHPLVRRAPTSSVPPRKKKVSRR